MLDSYKHSQPTLWGHATRDLLQGLARGLAPFDPHPGGRGKEHHGRAAGSLGKDPSQRSGAGRVAGLGGEADTQRHLLVLLRGRERIGRTDWEEA